MRDQTIRELHNLMESVNIGRQKVLTEVDQMRQNREEAADWIEQ